MAVELTENYASSSGAEIRLAVNRDLRMSGKTGLLKMV